MRPWQALLLSATTACGADYYDKAPPPLPATKGAEAPKREDLKRPAHVLGKPVPQEVEDAAWGLLQRCADGDGSACTELGKLQASTSWGARDDARASELFSRACEQGDAAGCESLAEAYTHGRGVARDVGRGRELHERACRGQRAFACARLGAYYAVGYGVPRDAKRALGYLKRACEEGDSGSCELSGALDGCAAGDKDACRQIDDLGARYEAEGR